MRRYRALEAEFAVADLSPLRIGIGTVAAAIVAHGTVLKTLLAERLLGLP